MELSFILIDDSELDCFISRKIIGHTDRNIVVKSFQNANVALDLVKNTPVEDLDNPELITIILLDLIMPLMDGFEFIEAFEMLPPAIQNKYNLVVLSSTRNSNDFLRSMTYSSIKSIVEKPLTFEKLYSLIIQTQQGVE